MISTFLFYRDFNSVKVCLTVGICLDIDFTCYLEIEFHLMP
jgi:hypothetical protein